jgi:hypothetical protein
LHDSIDNVTRLLVSTTSRETLFFFGADGEPRGAFRLTLEGVTGHSGLPERHQKKEETMASPGSPTGVADIALIGRLTA